MSNPTSNYSFQMPTSTDLVTDLPADFEVFGQAVDTQMKTNADAATQKATLTTTGDIYYASSASTPARLGIGSTGQVLTVAGGVPSWATAASGGMTLLSTTTLSGASTTISGISGSYNSLYGIVYGVTNATADGEMRMALNGVTSGNTQFMPNSGTTVTTATNDYFKFVGAGFFIARANSTNAWAFTIDNYASTTTLKPIQCYGMYYDATARRAYAMGGGYESTSAITSLVLSNSGGAWSTGTVLLYGVK